MRYSAGLAALPLCLVLAACGGGNEEAESDAGREAADTSAPDSAAVPATASGERSRVSVLLDCAREEGVTLISAHRGGPAAGVPENSLAAIRRAAELGAAFAEVDLSRTADGAIVLMHDDTLERTTTGTGPVNRAYLGDLRRLRLLDPDGAETGETIPTVDEAFALAEEIGIYLQLDLKDLSAADAARIASDVGQAGRSLIIAYTVDDAQAARLVSGGIGLSVSAENPRALQATALETDGVFAWLGGGLPSARLDADFAEIGVETGAHAFREEEAGEADYAAWRSAGVEVLAVDDVAAAAEALGAARTHCPGSFR